MIEKLQGLSDRLNMCTATLLALQAALQAQSRAEPECCRDELVSVKRAKGYVRAALEETAMLQMMVEADLSNGDF